MSYCKPQSRYLTRLNEKLQAARAEINSAAGQWMWRVRSWVKGATYMVESGMWVFVTDEEMEATKNQDENGMKAVYTKTKQWWKE